jgi:endonuclease III
MPRVLSKMPFGNVPMSQREHIGNRQAATAKLRIVIRRLEKTLGIPIRKSAKELPDPLDMLVATILSQNTNDSNSYRAFVHLKKRFPEYGDILNTSRRSLEAVIRSGGMARQKSGRIRELLKTILKKQGSLSLNYLKRMSDTEVLDELTSYNGVGVKTAACVLLFAMGRDAFPVDTHVHRVLNRVGIIKTNIPEKTFYSIGNLIPRGKAYSFHTNCIRFGRSVCKSQRPLCMLCPLIDICVYDKKFIKGGSTAKMPLRNPKKGDFMLLDNV